MKVLVTGGAGYIGSTTAARLVEAGHEIVVLDTLEKGHREAIPDGAELVVGDFGDRAVLDQILPRVEAVMHFAAYIEVGESMQNAAKYFRNNSANALTLLEAMLHHKVNKFVFSSTAALFGNPRRVPIEEGDELRPTNAYGESKLLVEKMLRWFHQVHGLRYASLRYFNACGAARGRGEDHSPETHLIPLILQVAQGKREHISVFGTDYPTPDGTCVRDYIHIWDLASAHVLALEALDEKHKQIYNLGNGRGFSVKEVIDVVRKVTGHPIPVVEAPRRPGDPAELVASSARIRSELGWTPEYTDLEDIVRSAWEWHQKHPQGYSSAKARA